MMDRTTSFLFGGIAMLVGAAACTRAPVTYGPSTPPGSPASTSTLPGSPASSTPPGSPVARPRLAPQCPELRASKRAASVDGGAPPVASNDDAGRQFPLVVVQVASVRADRASFKAFLALSSAGPSPSGPFDSPLLTIDEVHEISTRIDVPTTIEFPKSRPDASPSQECPCGAQNRLTITPHLAESGNIRLEWRESVQSAWKPNGPCPTEKILAQTTFTVQDQQRVALGKGDAIHAGQASFLVITPFLIEEPEGLRRLFECRVRAASTKGSTAAAGSGPRGVGTTDSITP